MRKLVVATATIGASMAVYRRWLTPWHQRWGATDNEVSSQLPGDDVVAEPAFQVTRAITIDAPPGDVWPWLIQIGADRGGFYSYDRLENLFGLDIHSASSIVPEWQDLDVGDVVYADRARDGGWYVVDLRPNDALVLKVADLAAGRPLHRDDKAKWEFAWTFAVRPDGADGTRLLVRERAAFGNAFMRALMAPVGLVSFVMTRRTMLGIKRRAETWHQVAPEQDPVERRRRRQTVPG